MAKGEKEENPVCLFQFMACNRIPAEQEMLGGEEKQEKNRNGKEGIFGHGKGEKTAG